jgi:hypothetical protein
MHRRWNKAGIIFIVFFTIIGVNGGYDAFALSSPNYSIDEDFIGGGGVSESSSPSYFSQDTIGGVAVGDGAGSAYKTQSGATTTSDPMLEFSVSTTNVALGALMTSLTRTGTANFSVRNYTSSGYIVQAIGAPPSNGVHTLAGMPVAAASSLGVEQFGMNLVANTSPATFGANPLQVPSVDFSYGSAGAGYDTANQYRYVSGDTIAVATQSSGRADYTVSYIANISSTTPGGVYTGTQTLVCTGTY